MQPALEKHQTVLVTRKPNITNPEKWKLEKEFLLEATGPIVIWTRGPMLVSESRG